MPNIYRAKIISHGLSVTQGAKHTPEVKLQVKTINEIPSGTPVEKTFYVDLWLTEKAVDRTMKTLRDIGYNEDTMANLNSEILVGTFVEIVTEWEEYDGKQYERVKFMNPDGNYAQRGVKQCDMKMAANICGKYDSMLRNIAKTKKAAAKAKPAPENPYHTDPGTAAMRSRFDAAPANSMEDDDGLPF